MSISQIIDKYETAVDELPVIHATQGGGKSRNASGLVYENLIKDVCEYVELTPKKNDYKQSEIVDGSCIKNLQVDWHIYNGEFLTHMVESKTYLDACYLKRAVMDFIEMENSPEVPDNTQYAILTGQSCVSDDAFKYYLALFTKLTGKSVDVFIVNPQKRRDAKRPIYEESNRVDFVLDTDELNRFISWLK